MSEMVQELTKALRHLMQSNHGFKPEACDACADANRALSAAARVKASNAP